MKNKLKLYYLLFLMASCKYEDGPLISLTSPTNRVKGFYTIDCVQENGTNIMSRIDTLNITSYYFGGPSEIVGPNYNDFSVEIAGSVTYPSFWFFHDSDDKHLTAETFGCGYPPFTPPPFQPLPGFSGSCSESSLVWTITKLSQKKMWLEADFNGNHYEVHLKQ